MKPGKKSLIEKSRSVIDWVRKYNHKLLDMTLEELGQEHNTLMLRKAKTDMKIEMVYDRYMMHYVNKIGGKVMPDKEKKKKKR